MHAPAAGGPTSLAKRQVDRVHSRMATPKKNDIAKKPARASKTAAEKPKGKSGQKAARTATGKRSNPARLAAAQQEAQEGLKERTEEGHRAAGRMPPSQTSARRSAGAVRKIDNDIRDFTAPITEDEKLLQAPDATAGHSIDFRATDTWRVMRIMGEFIEGFDNLATVERGVSIFG